MSKYEPLWIYIKEKKEQNIELSFEEIHAILTFPIDHSFLTYKKELGKYGYSVQKIEMKNQKVYFQRIESGKCEEK